MSLVYDFFGSVMAGVSLSEVSSECEADQAPRLYRLTPSGPEHCAAPPAENQLAMAEFSPVKSPVCMELVDFVPPNLVEVQINSREEQLNPASDVPTVAASFLSTVG